MTPELDFGRDKSSVLSENWIIFQWLSAVQSCIETGCPQMSTLQVFSVL